MDEQSKTKRLNLMRYWLFGTFVIVFAATTTYAAAAIMRLGGAPLMAVQISFPIWAITGVVSVLIYYGYKFLYLKNK